MMTKLALSCVAILVVVITTSHSAAQHSHVRQQSSRQYVLQGGGHRSTATFDGHHLTIDDGGQSFTYNRVERLDSQDGSYLSFHNNTLNKTILFPIDGQGNMFLQSAGGNWVASQMTVQRVRDGRQNGQVNRGLHRQIDRLALKLQSQAGEIAREIQQHYRHTPGYGHLMTDAQQVINESRRVHLVAHRVGSLTQIAGYLEKLDGHFHHMEETWGQIEANAAAGHGHTHGNTHHVAEVIHEMEDNLHQLRDLVDAVRRREVFRPVAPQTGQFTRVDQLAHRLEEATNTLLLDMHHNYSHNPGFRETYRETYQLITAAKAIQTLADRRSYGQIASQLPGMTDLVHHIEDDVRNWTRYHRRTIGPLSLSQEVEAVDDLVHRLFDDAGVQDKEIAPPPQ